MCRSAALIVVLTAVALSGCSTPIVIPQATPTAGPGAGQANPASVFCREQGGRLELRTAADGSQSGICRFPDGSQCEEWAFYRGQCGPGPAAGVTATANAVGTATPGGAATRPTPVAPTAPIPTAAVSTPTGAATYTSSALGVSFSYLPRQVPEPGVDVKVTEQGDRIYVHFAHMEPAAGQWVQVFKKTAGESLVAAITRLIMPGHPAENCRVMPISAPAGSPGASPDMEYAAIVVPALPGESMEARLPRWQTCPQTYTAVGGIGYFQADLRHADRFIYLSIGQYGIMAGDGLPWQATIRLE